MRKILCALVLLSSTAPTYALDAAEREWARGAIATKEEAIATELPGEKERRCANNLPPKRLAVCVSGIEGVIAGRENEKLRLKLMLAADSLPPKEKAKFANLLSLKAYDELNTQTTAIYKLLMAEFPEHISALPTLSKSQ